MKMLASKRLFLSLFISLAFYLSNAQTGAPLLTHYKEVMEMENQCWSICQDDKGVMMFANRRGILTFDGQEWSFISIPIIPYSIEYNDSLKRVYIGGADDYGYLVRDEKGIYHFKSMLNDNEKTGVISRIFFTDSTVYFYGEESISRHNLESGKLEIRFLQKESKPFTGMFITARNTFINVFSEGLYRIDSDTLFPLVTGYLLRYNDVLFSLPFNDKMVLLGMGNGELSLFDGIKFYFYPVKDEGYLKQNILSDGILISDTLYAFSTLEGGTIVVEKKSGALRKTINYLRGLPDDEIFALGTDNNNGLWLSHQYGLTRADLMLPVGNFSIYKGLTGNLISSQWHGNELYVATSEGVFYLAQVKDFEKEEILVRKVSTDEKAVGIKPAEITSEQLKTPVDQEAQRTRKSVLSRIFGKRQAGETPVENAEKGAGVDAGKRVAAAARTEPEYVRKTISRLKSVNYEFRKISGLDEKSKQLVSTNAGILVATNKGLYVINNHAAKPLVNDKYIYSISRRSSDNRYYIASSDGYFYVSPGEGGWNTVYPDRDFSETLYSVTPADDNTLWSGAENKIIRIIPGNKPEYRHYNIKSDFPLDYVTNYKNDTLFVFSLAGISYYDEKADSVLQYLKIDKGSGINPGYIISQPESPWIRHADEWLNLSEREKVTDSDRSILKVFDNIVSITSDSKSLWVITGDNQIYRIVLNSAIRVKLDLGLFLKSIRNDKGDRLVLSDVVVKAGENLVFFDLVAPGYLKKNSIQYQWKIEKLMDEWSPWQTSSVIPAPLQYGTFTISVRAKDIWGNISDPESLSFTRKAPFSKTPVFFLVVIIISLVIIAAIIRFRERHLLREKRILEEKVKERTAEIEAQKEEITSSIEYASRIQHAMLPVDEMFQKYFPDHFILFRPRDIVSGDFYWIGENAQNIFFTVADCTGHGVPGAFMSTLGISTLNEIITNKKNLHANVFLNHLREIIKRSLHQTGKEGEAADGMDVSFCMLNKDRRVLEYSGAFNPLLIAQNGEIKEYKADRMPIGIYVGEKESFTNYEIMVSPGDVVYLFSDGFTDQFGGPEGSKYKRACLKKLLSEIHHLPLEEQKVIISREFDDWKGKLNQIDDVTILGVRV